MSSSNLVNQTFLLSEAQNAIFAGQILDPENYRFNAAFYLTLMPEVDGEVFLSASYQLAKDARLQRVVLENRIGVWVQSVEVPPEAVTQTICLKDIEQAKAWMDAEFQKPFRLTEGVPLYRQWLIYLETGQSIFFVKYHHIVLDGFGQNLLLKRLEELYSSLSEGTAVVAAHWSTETQYFEELQRRVLSVEPTEVFDLARVTYRDLEGVATLGQCRSNLASGLCQSRFSLKEDFVERLSNSAQFHDVPLSVLLTTLVASYFHRVTGEDRILLGLPVTARTRQALIAKPSMQSNEWPLNFDFTKFLDTGEAEGFSQLVNFSKGEMAKAMSNQGIRNEALHIALDRTGLDEKLTKTLVNVLPFGSSVELAGRTVDVHQIATGPVGDLTINIFLKNSQIDFLWDANPDNYTQQQMDRHAERFAKYLNAFLNDTPIRHTPESLYLENDVLASKKLIGSAQSFDLQTPLFVLIDQQATQFPDTEAVSCEEYKLSYAQLKTQTDELARALLKHGTKSGSAIGIYGNRSTLMTIAILGIQKAGCAYVPLDPDLPQARLESQIQQAGIQLVLHWDQAPVFDVETKRVSMVETNFCSDELTLPDVSPEMPSYVLFTSGSTGNPKGVAVSHSALANRIHWMQLEYNINQNDRILQKTPFTFDVSIWEFFWPLIVGARLVMAPPQAHKDPRTLLDVIKQHGITTLHFIPVMLDMFLPEVADKEIPIKRIFCSGEALKPATVGETFKTLPSVELHNLYGPTEAAIDVTHWRCSPADAQRLTVPIGWPVANTQLWVLDASMRPTVPGVPGELYIGGPQVALGYVNQPELTADRFLEVDEIKGRLYRTGDLAVLSEDNGLEFLGRIDHQVKIRGLRIELAEIESRLLASSLVQQAVVNVRSDDTTNTSLIGYLVMKNRSALGEVQTELASVLPEYMIPSQWMLLDDLPLMPSGKVNRRALPNPALVDEKGEAALNEMEALLQRVWESVLKIKEIGVTSQFFALGGDSMMAIRVRTAVEQEGWTFDLAELFRNPSIRQLAPKLRASSEIAVLHRQPFQDIAQEDRALLPIDDLEDAFAMSAMQESMVYQTEIDQGSSVYRVVTSLTLERPLVKAHLEEALQCILQRHPLLRSSFDLSSYSQPLVLIHSSVETPIYYEQSLTHLDEADQQTFIRGWADEAKLQTFDLKNAPGLRFYVHLAGESRFQLSVVEHHAVLDGWSDLLMFDEIVECYERLLNAQVWQPEPLRSSYAEFISKEANVLEDDEARRYWQTVTENIDGSPLPQREAPASTDHRAFHADIPDALHDTLLKVAATNQCSIKSLLVAAHLVALGAITGDSQVATGLVFNGRLDCPDGDKAIGVFLNTLPLSLSLENTDFIDVARQVADFEYKSYQYGRYPYNAMQREARNPLNLETYVNYMDFHRQWGEGSMVSEAFGIANTNFPLAVNFLIDPITQSLSLWFDCDLAQLDPHLCERLPEYYIAILQHIARDPHGKVSSAVLVTAVERETLDRWNQTDLALSSPRVMFQQFEQQVERTPHRIALSHLDSTLNYEDLNQMANRIAHALVDAEVKLGQTVGICISRSPKLVACLLAVQKIGAVFLPLDPKYPLDRLNYIVEDSELKLVLTDAASPDINTAISLMIDDEGLLESSANGNLIRPVDPSSVAYSIYTSGSTGRPKGTLVTHRNLTNFLAGMDDAVGCGMDDTMLALTSVSFDISILELLWPLTKGAKVVLGSDSQVQLLSDQDDVSDKPLDFSLFFFGSASGLESRSDSYNLVLDAARYADQNRFKAIWTPERHFHEFGGLYPNPSVLSAALAAITKNVELRSGSVVAPLHDSLRLTEEWALVDNLSQGRVGLAFASGWNSNDFALAPENYSDRKSVMLEKLEELRTLWSGGKISRLNGEGQTVELGVFPRPIRADLPIWLTSAGAVSTFEMAGTLGLNVLTHLLGQDIGELTKKIAAYRAAWDVAGHVGQSHVSLMVHTFLSDSENDAKARAKGPFRDYLRTSAGLLRQLTASMNMEFPDAMDGEDMEIILDMAVERYFETSGLFGSPESVLPLLQNLQEAGVDEIASLIDFGLPNEDVLQGLSSINKMRLRHKRKHKEAAFSCERLMREHDVTMVQSTPSFLTAVMSDEALLEAMKSLKTLLVGGETFPPGLAVELRERLPARMFNMYGPTETTIWSCYQNIDEDCNFNNRIPIGRPIANTKIRILNAEGQYAPIGAPGELWIGGDGVCAGYWNQSDLTDERFQILDDGHPYYRTGDRARWQHDGTLLFLGRVDRQVKLRGHRIELDEVEGILSHHKGIRNVAVLLQEMSPGTSELVAYVEGGESIVTDDEAQQLITNWGQLWNDAYLQRLNQPDPTDRTADFSGWLSSYTGEPIPLIEMEEWLEHALQKIEAYDCQTIVDVGVGMGLFLRRLIHDCEHYIGIDLSQEALNACEMVAKQALVEGNRLSVIQGDAMALNQLQERQADLVLVNSVVQYFPDEGYLAEMLTEAFRVVRETGVVFLGDIRCLDQLDLFHARVQFEKANPLTPLSEIKALIQSNLQTEKELCLAPGFFAQLREKLPQVEDVQLELKRGQANNELNDFRFDAVLFAQRSKQPTGLELVNKAPKMSPSVLADITNKVSKAYPQFLVIRGLPNHRLDKTKHIGRLLKEMKPDATKWDLEKKLWEIDCETMLSPENVARHFEDLGYRVRLLLHPERGLHCFDLELSMKGDRQSQTHSESKILESAQ